MRRGSLLGRVPRWALACGLAVGLASPAAARPQDAQPGGADLASGLGVQFTDKLLRLPDWRPKVDLAAALGAAFVRVDLNWDWTEIEAGRYDWSLYDAFATELGRRGLRPLFILNRPNRLHGRPYIVPRDGTTDIGTAAPESPAEIAAFARWAAAAASRFKAVDPIWEIWNEPDERGFWPPTPNPAAYVALARATCTAIKRAVPGSVVIGPAAAAMPMIWGADKPLLTAVLKDPELTRCLDAVSLHTHRFRQAPETVSRDYAIYRRGIADLPGRALPVLDTEWGDSVHRGGVSEQQQARWLPRMVLTNRLEGVNLTNWYCLFDTGDNDDALEDRFGLVARDGRLRPAYRAFQTLARELRGYTLRQTISRFDSETAKGTTILLFCAPSGRCKLAAWTTEDEPVPVRRTIQGWTLAGSLVGHLGRKLPTPRQAVSSVTLDLTPDVQFVEVRPSRAESE